MSTKAVDSMGKLLVLTLNEQDEKVIDKIISALADCIQIEVVYLKPFGAWIVIAAIQALST